MTEPDFAPMIAAVRRAAELAALRAKSAWPPGTLENNLRTVQRLLEAMADRDFIPRLLCCGGECRAAEHCGDHDLSADGYARRYGCESDACIQDADAFLAALLARAAER